MDQATKLITAAIWKLVPLIVTAAFLLAAAAAAGFELVKQNSQWSSATKRLVYSGLVFSAAVAWVLFFIRMRSGA